MTGILPFGKLHDMMPHALSALLLAIVSVLPVFAHAETVPHPSRPTSATIIIHEDVKETKPGEVPLAPDLCRPETLGQIHIVNDRIHICRKRG